MLCTPVLSQDECLRTRDASAPTRRHHRHLHVFHELNCSNENDKRTERAVNENVDSCRLTSTHTVLEEIESNFLCHPRRLSAHSSAHVTPGEGHTDCRTCKGVSLNSDGAGVPLDANTKEAEATRNSTPRKDVGAVLPATAARAHNYDTFAFRVCEKQLSPKELSHLVEIHEGRVRSNCQRSRAHSHS